MIKKIFALLVLLTIIVSALVILSEFNFAPEQPQGATIDPDFTEIASVLKSLDQVTAITDAIIQKADGIKYQAVDVAILAFNPAKPDQKAYLVPIAKYFELGTLPASLTPVDQAERADKRISDGIRIWDELFPILDKYSKYIGKPLTPLVFNSENDTYQQYFESLGFYRNRTDPPGKIHLLPYGYWWYPKTATGPTPGPIGIPTIFSVTQAENRILSKVARLEEFDPGFVGAKLTEAFEAQDAEKKKIFVMVFDNMALYIEASDPRQVKLLPVPVLIGSPVQSLQQRNMEPDNTFFQVNGDQGYNVKTIFANYAETHSGLAGKPIGNTSKTEKGFLQCFENYCLETINGIGKDGEPDIRLLPYGREYLKIIGKEANLPIQPTPTPTQVPLQSRKTRLISWHQAADVISGKPTSIGAAVFQNLDPMANVNLYTTIYLPDGGQQSFSMPPTNGSGKTQVDITGLNIQANFLNYDVCIINNNNASDFCVSDTFYYRP